MRAGRPVLRFAARVVVTYAVCWHVALGTVLAWDGILTTPGVSLAELASEYARSLPFATVQSGSEIAAFTETLAAFLTMLVAAACLAWREWGPVRHASRVPPAQ